jgi:hypothetical protein
MCCEAELPANIYWLGPTTEPSLHYLHNGFPWIEAVPIY